MRYVLLLLAVAGVVVFVWTSMGDPARSRSEEGAPRGSIEDGATDPGVTVPRAIPAAQLDDRVRVAEQSAATDSAAAAEPVGAVVAPSLAGVVLWDDDRTPLAGFAFALRFASDDSVVRIETDASGRFTLEGGAPEGVAYPLHRPSTPDGPFAERLRFAARLIAIRPGQTERIELLVRRPAARLAVRVVLRDGTPEPDAVVAIVRQEEVRPGEMRAFGDENATDELGIARFAMYDLAKARSIDLVARQSPERADDVPLVSLPESVELPLTPALLQAPLTLVLDDAATLVVRVVTPAGAPVAGKRVLVAYPERDLGVEAEEIPVTDADGSVRVDGLVPGEVAVWVVESPVADAARVTLAPGETREIRIELNAFATRLAVAGRVVDESGGPVAGASLSLAFSERAGAGVTTAIISSREDGAFSFDAEPCELVTVRADASLTGDVFDPPSAVVPFGTRELVFRRTEHYPVVATSFEVVDAATGEPCRGAFVLSFRAPNRDVYAFHIAEDGRAAPRVSSHPDTTLVVTAPGYRRRELLRSDLAATASRVALDPGVHRVVMISGEDAGGETVPLIGARVFERDRLVAEMSSPDGVLVDLFAAPASDLRIEATGFEPATWNPVDDLGELGPAWVWMNRVE